MSADNLVDIYTDYAKDIYRFCMLKVQNREQAEDLTSDTFLKLSEQDINSIENPKAWLYTVARNKMYDSFLKKKSLNIDGASLESVPDSGYSVEEYAFTDTNLEVIHEALKELDDVTSDIIVLKTWDNMQFNEIAEIVGLSTEATKKRYYRGVEELKTVVNKPSRIKKLGISIISIPILLGGIAQVASRPVLASSSSFLSSLQPLILSITNKSMLGGLTGAFASNSAAGSFFATTGGKIAVAVVGTAVVATSGAGVVHVVNNNNNNSEHANNSTNCKIESYSNQNFGISFDYDSCEWDIATEMAKEDAGLPEVLNISLKNDANSLNFEVKPMPVFGFGPNSCRNAEESKFAVLNLNNFPTGGKYFSEEDNSWIYSEYLISIEDADDFIIDVSKNINANFNENASGYCNPWPFSTKTSFINETEIGQTGANMSAVVTISYSGNDRDVTKADTVISTIKTNPVFNHVAETNPECNINTYKNDKYPEFSFKYDDCTWTDISEYLDETRAHAAQVGDQSEVITLTHKSGNFLSFSLSPVLTFGSGPMMCSNVESSLNDYVGFIDNGHFVSGGRVATQNFYAYSPEYITLDQLSSAYDQEFIDFLKQNNTATDFSKAGACWRSAEIYIDTNIKNVTEGFDREFLAASLSIRTGLVDDKNVLSDADDVVRSLTFKNAFSSTPTYKLDNSFIEEIVNRNKLVESSATESNFLRCSDGYEDTLGNYKSYRLSSESSMISTIQYTLNHLPQNGWALCREDSSTGGGFGRAYKKGEEVIYVQSYPGMGNTENEKLHFNFSLHARY